MTTQAQVWALVLPLKRLALAKSRLAVPASVRSELALAMALDTVRACLPLGDLMVVTDDDDGARAMRELGAQVCADTPDAGLNPALVHAAQLLRADRPDYAVAALASDLPALRTDGLRALLARAAAYESVCVADAAGSGTTVLTANSGVRFEPVFGPDSRRRHVEAGSVDLTAGADPRLRQDVDTLADLQAAAELGCGSSTTALLDRTAVLLG